MDPAEKGRPPSAAPPTAPGVPQYLVAQPIPSPTAAPQQPMQYVPAPTTAAVYHPSPTGYAPAAPAVAVGVPVATPVPVTAMPAAMMVQPAGVGVQPQVVEVVTVQTVHPVRPGILPSHSPVPVVCPHCGRESYTRVAYRMGAAG